MVLVDGAGTPLGAYLETVSSAEATLLEQPLDTVAIGRPGTPRRPRKRPARLVADRGYDSNPLRARLARRGIAPIIPARSTHKRGTHQDGRKLWRYDSGGLWNGPLPAWGIAGTSSSAMSS
jgi:hypothetical protein